MSIDLSKLSSKELFELAKQREKEEQEAAQRVTMLQAVRQKRDSMVAEHEAALVATDKAIRELEARREKQLEDFEAALAPLELEIAELERSIEEDKARANEAATAPIPQPTAAAPALQRPSTILNGAGTAKPAIPSSAASAPKPIAPSSAAPAPETNHTKAVAEGGNGLDGLYQLVRGMLRNRTYISESLLKEKLKAANFDTSNLRKQLDQLIHERRIENKGRGNYALGKRK